MTTNRKDKPMNRYYVSFSYGTTFTIGSADVSLPNPISGKADIAAVRTWLTQQGYANVAILAFSAYADQPKPAAAPQARPATSQQRPTATRQSSNREGWGRRDRTR